MKRPLSVWSTIIILSLFLVFLVVVTVLGVTLGIQLMNASSEYFSLFPFLLRMLLSVAIMLFLLWSIIAIFKRKQYGRIMGIISLLILIGLIILTKMQSSTETILPRLAYDSDAERSGARISNFLFIAIYAVTLLRFSFADVVDQYFSYKTKTDEKALFEENKPEIGSINSSKFQAESSPVISLESTEQPEAYSIKTTSPINPDDKSSEQALLFVKSVLGHIPEQWFTIQEVLKTNPESLCNQEQYAQYNFEELIENETSLIFLFVQAYLEAEDAIIQIDWRGESDEGEIARFVIQRIEALTSKTLDASIAETLYQISAYDYVQKQIKDEESYLEYVFININSVLNKIGFSLLYINRAWDSHHFFITQLEHVSKLKEIQYEDDDVFTIEDTF